MIVPERLALIRIQRTTKETPVSIAMTKRPVLVAMLLLMASLLAALIAPMRVPGGGITEATTTLYACQGTWYFDSSSAGVEFHEGDVWQDGTFSDIEDDHMMLVRLDDGHEVGRFPDRGTNPFFGDSSTITFASPVRIVAILWHDNDPNVANGETGWSFNGTPGPLTGNGGTIVTPVDITTSTVNISAGGDSGGIDFCFTPVDGGGGQGCTPGYWKQAHHFDSWVGYVPSQTLESVFDIPDAFGVDNQTLLQALSYSGGPSVADKARILLRQAVAAVLNASSPNVSYEFTTAEVIASVNAALASNNKDTILGLKDVLDWENNRGCPLN